MKSMYFSTVTLCISANHMFGLSLVHMQSQQQQEQQMQNRRGEAAHGIRDAASNTIGSDRVFASIAVRRDDSAMIEFVKQYLASEGKFVAQNQQSELAGFVQWFDGTKAIQDFDQMKKELTNKTWVKDLRTIDSATLSEADYQAVAQNHNDTAMMLFVHRLLEGEKGFISKEEQGELAGFVPWFSGTKAIQSLEKLRVELWGKPWVRKQKSVGVAVHAATAGTEKKNSTVARGTAEVASHQKSGVRADMVGPIRNEQAQLALLRPTSGSEVTSKDSKAMKVSDSMDAPAAKCSACIIHRDAKILSFNAYRNRAKAHPNKQVELYAHTETEDQLCGFDAGTYLIVNSTNVQIQGRYWRHTYNKPGVVLGAMAIGGPAVGNNLLVIRALSGEITWNGQETLTQVLSSLSNEFLEAKYVADVGPVAGDGHAAGVKIKLANGMRLTVARHQKHLSALIELCKSHAGAAPVAGQCGNLEEIPRRDAHVWLAVQTASEKLPKSKFIF